MARGFGRLWGVGLAVVALGAGCGGEFAEPQPNAPQVVLRSMPVIADPRGHEFEGATEVTLQAPDDSSAQIFFTTDGSPASGETAQLYQGPIVMTETTLLSFIARTREDIWSESGSELYVAAQPELQTSADPRVLKSDPESLFFVWRPGERTPMRRVITVRSTGERPVQINKIALGLNPNGEAFWEGGAFLLASGTEPRVLLPGSSFDITVVYEPTRTLRSASIIIESDQSDQDMLIELWGRISPW